MPHLLGDAIFWIAAVCCLVAQVAIIRSTLLPHSPAEGAPTVPRPRTGLEAAWVLLPALLLAGVLAVTWRAIHAPRAASQAQVSTSAPPRVP